MLPTTVRNRIALAVLSSVIGVLVLASAFRTERAHADPRPSAPAADRVTESRVTPVEIAARGAGGNSASVASETGSDDAAGRWAEYYGFLPPEIYRVTKRSGNLLAADLGSDGRTDLLLVDNSNSRLDVFVQQAGGGGAKNAKPLGVNEIPDDRRLDHQKITVDVEVGTAAVGDFNGDGHTDVAYLGVPDQLIVRLQPRSGAWTERHMLRLPDVEAARWSLAAGRFAGEQRDEVVILGKRETFRVRMSDDGSLEIRERLLNTSDNLSLCLLRDIDGDARVDLVYFAAEGTDRRIVAARLQQDDGSLGPELRFDLQEPRAITFGELDGRPGEELLVIESRTNRIKVLQFQQPAVEPGQLAKRMLQYGIGKPSRQRDLAVGDIDGDKRTDVVVADPDAAELILFRQRGSIGLDLGTPQPSFLGAAQVRAADFTGNGVAEVIVLSSKEKAVGLSHWDGERLTFPQPLPIANEPLAIETADLNADNRPELLIVVRDRESRSAEFQLHALQYRPKEKEHWVPYSLINAKAPANDAAGAGETAGLTLPLRGNPERLLAVFANADRRPDFLVFPDLGREPIPVISADDGWHVAEPKPGLSFGEVGAAAVFSGDLNGPALLAAHERFVRRMTFDDGRWAVADQFNAGEARAKLVGTAAVNLDGQPGNELVLVDAGVRKLRVFRRDQNTMKPWQEIELGDFPFQGVRVADLNADEQPDLLVFGQNKFAVLYAGRTDPSLREVASFEKPSDDKKSFLMDLFVGDINGDRRPDVCVIDALQHAVTILAVVRTDAPGDSRSASASAEPATVSPTAARRTAARQPAAGKNSARSTEAGKPRAAIALEHALTFPVFEEKSFSSKADFEPEPREAVIADVTNDGRNDLILLAHDRVLVYPQDPGPTAQK